MIPVWIATKRTSLVAGRARRQPRLGGLALLMAFLAGTLVLSACTPPWDSRHATTPTPSATRTQASQPPCITPSPQGPAATEQELIAQSLQAGKIDRGTALLYRFYALIDDTRLPQELVGAGIATEDLCLMEEARAQFAILPANEQQQLHPFLVRPNHPDSYFNHLPSATPAGLTGPASPVQPARGGAPASRAGVAGVPSVPSITCPRGWHAETSAQYRIKVWAPCGSTPDQAAAAQRAAQGAVTTLDQIIRAEEGVMHIVPKPDDATYPYVPPDDGNDDDRIDVYLAPLVHRESQANGVDGRYGRTFQTNCVVKERQCSGYILSDPNSGHLGNALAHEFFHLLQLAYDAYVGYDPLAGCALYCPTFWFYEASAVWAASYFWSFDRYEAHIAFTAFEEKLQTPLDSLVGEHDYEAYVWALYMEQHHGPGSIQDAWQALRGTTSWDAAMDALNRVVSFDTEFHSFAVENLNQPLDGAIPSYKAVDPDIPGTHPKAHPLGPPLDLFFPAEEAKPGFAVTVAYDADIPRLAADYNLVVVLPPEQAVTTRNLHQVTFDFSTLVGDKDVDVDLVVITRGGQWHQVPALPKAEVCDVDAVFVILSNHNRHGGPPAGTPAHRSWKVSYGNHRC